MSLHLDIERATYVSWPAFEQIEHEGWVLRFADGCTKRANSVNVIGPVEGPLDAAVDFCESFYRERSQPAIFRQLSFVEDFGLDALLADRAYAFTDPSLILYQQLKPGVETSCALPQMDRESWLEAYEEVMGHSLGVQEAHIQILQRVPAHHLYTAVRKEGQAVACGLGVIHEAQFGMFDIMTRVDCREQGYGTELIGGMLAWARQNGARHAYVQVLANNPAAIRLYEKFGYRRLYHYWYRVKKWKAVIE